MKKLISALMLLGTVFGVSGLSSQALAEPVVIIVNPSTGLSNISKGNLKKVFLGKSGEINGTAVTTVKSKREKTYGVFRQRILRLSKKKEKTYWLKEIMKNRVKVVKQVDNDWQVAEFVNSNSEGIGIISQSVYDSARSRKFNVKALKINGTSHDSDKYPLK